MTSFLDKLNNRLGGNEKSGGGFSFKKITGVEEKTNTESSEKDLTEIKTIDIDVYQNPKEIIIYAMAAGVDPVKFEIILDEENDLLTIRGTRERPDKYPKIPGENKDPEGKYIIQECAWEKFYRKVVLPVDVDAVKAEAVFKKGVLIITLPILNIGEGRKLNVVEVLTKNG